MTYLDETADLAHLRDSGFTERFLEVLEKLRSSIVSDIQTDRYGR